MWYDQKTPLEAAAAITRDGYNWNTYAGISFDSNSHTWKPIWETEPSGATATMSAHLGEALTISYGFRDTAPTYTSPYGNNQQDFSKATPDEMIAVSNALHAWAEFARITLVPTNPNGYTNDEHTTILVGNYMGAPGSLAYAYASGPVASTPEHFEETGDIWINRQQNPTLAFTPGGEAYQAVLHEIGHAFGLEHPGNYPKFDPVTQQPLATDFLADAGYLTDTTQHSIMSYFDPAILGANWTYMAPEPGNPFHNIPTRVFASTPMVDDIVAIQRLYGQNFDTRHTDTTYGFNSNAGEPYLLSSSSEQVVMTIWDGGGTDTLDFSGYSTNQLISLIPGSYSNVGALTGNVAVAYTTDPRAMIENAIGGSGNDTLIGNAGANTLTGNGGNDTFIGDAGNDRLYGGQGNDTVSYANDYWGVNVDLTPDRMAVFSPTAGSVGHASGTWIGSDTLYSIENIIGGHADDHLTGDGNANLLQGNAGNDTLNGAGGSDTASYEGMNQSVTVNLMGDLLRTWTGAQYYGAAYARGADAGDDTLISIENVIGGNNDDIITGTNDSNRLEGGAGKDKLYGLGGDDTLIGGPGNDLMDGGGGTNTADYSATTQGVTVYLDTHLGGTGPYYAQVGPSASGVESGNDTLVSIQKVIGGSGADTIYGNGEANDIDGRGGVDRMYGGRGDDFYHVDLPNDAVIENANSGTDTVFSTAQTYTLSAYVENLILLGFTTTTAISNISYQSGQGAIGNELANKITGSVYQDFIQGGAGGDTIIGGQGGDSIYPSALFAGDDRATDIIRYTALDESAPSAPDHIFGFVAGGTATSDRIDFTALSSNSATKGGGPLHVVSHFDGHAGEIVLTTVNGDTHIDLYADANSVVDMSIIVQSVTGLAAHDFIL